MGKVQTRLNITVEKTEKAHLLARKKQMELAFRDGKLERLIAFYTKLNPTYAEELKYTRKKIERSKQGPQ